MRTNIIILFVTILLGTGITYLLDKNSPPTQNTEQIQSIETTKNKVPDFEFTDLNGTNHNITDFTGKTVLLNFWATWCAPCVIEFPKFIKLAEKNPDIQIIALSSDSNDKNIHRFLEKQKPIPNNFLVARDDKRRITTDIFSTYKLPETLVISPSQEIVKKIVGDTDWDKETPSIAE